ncbi:MAG: rhodanese-like domain-containing protein [Crocinitomicaceae bacterium]|nr:rhodanese-like domain-containing protein [Crocinitomicaceae bacterium]
MKYITSTELKKKIDAGESVSVIDIRESYELDICKIDAIHIPMGEVSERVNEISKEVPAVILCRSGKRAIPVANLLSTEFGHTDVAILEGGILAWIEEVDSQLEAY